MSAASDNFVELRKNLPLEAMAPSAPIYTFDTSGEDFLANVKKEQVFACKASSDNSETAVSLKMMKIELDLKKAQLRKDQLEKERKLVDEDFKFQIELLDTEIQVAMTKLESLRDCLKMTSSKATTFNQTAGPMVANVKQFQLSSPAVESGVISGTNNKITGLPAGVVPVLTSIGLEQLRVLDCITIRQIRSRALDETYEVVAPGEDLVIFRVNVLVGLVGRRKAIRLEFIDNEVKEVMTFRGGNGQGQRRCMELHVCGQLACLVKRAPTFFKPMLVIHDTLSRPMLKLKGPCLLESKPIFQVQTLLKKGIGQINKRPAAPTQNYESTHAVIDFPLDLDVRYKAALIACNFLIVDERTREIRNRNIEAAMTSASDAQTELLNTDYPRN